MHIGLGSAFIGTTLWIKPFGHFAVYTYGALNLRYQSNPIAFAVVRAAAALGT